MSEFLQRSRAVIYLKRAIKEWDNGNPEQAWEPLQAGIRLLELLESGAGQRRDLAKACQLSGNIQLALGKPDSALDWYTRAEDLYKKDRGSRKDYGRFLHDTAIVFYELGIPKLALDYAKRSLEILRPFGAYYVSRVQEVISGIESEQEASGTEVDNRLRQLRYNVANARGPAEKAQHCDALATGLLYSGRAAENIEELHAAILSAFDYAYKKKDINTCLTALVALQDLYFKALPLPSWAENAARSVVALAEDRPNLDWIGRAHGLLAAALIAQERYSAALVHALTAVARHDEFALQTETSMIRFVTNKASSVAREIALEAAVELGDAALAAELIESARLQVLPDPSRSEHISPYTGDSITGHIRDYASSRLASLKAVSVGGSSRIRPFYSEGICRGETELEEVIEAVGGPAASWWGTLVVNGRVFWSFLIAGKSSCGRIDLVEGSLPQSLIEEAFQHSLRNREAKTLDILTGPWCRSYLAEERFSVELGSLLIPEILREHLAGADVVDHPCSVVLAGNLSALLPVPLLGVPSLRRNGFIARLVEVATLRVAPPAILIDRVLSYPAPNTDLYPIAIACADPRGDLPHSQPIPDGSKLTLTGSPGAGELRADRDSLITALRQIAPSTPGIFYYSGHLVAGGHGGDVEDGLGLADGEVLEAGSIFQATEDGRPVIPFPSRGLIAACESAGAGGSGAGEWLGLSASMLWAGARQVIATNWRIWDTVFTSRFDLLLVHALRSSHDVAASLRELQVEYLDDWRRSDHDFSEHRMEGLPGGSSSLPLPMIWGAYCCIGVL